MINLSAEAKWRLAATYQLIGQNEVAKDLVKTLTWKIVPYKELTNSYGSDTRDKAMILETLSLLKDKSAAKLLAKEVAESLSAEQWMSTQETAYSLLAMCKFVTGNGSTPVVNVSYVLNGSAATAYNGNSPVAQIKMEKKDLLKNGKMVIQNTGNTVLYVKMVRRGVPLIGDQTEKHNNMKMTVKYTDMKGVPIDIAKLVQGMDFIAEVFIENAGKRGHLHEMALSQVFPSGWEIHNSRMDEFNTYYNLNKSQNKTFKVKLNATYLGKFYLPTQETEAMYDNTIFARIPGRWVEVVKDDKVAVK